MSRGDRREDIFYDDVDRQDFVKTLAEACHKTGFQAAHALASCRIIFIWSSRRPSANLVVGMRRLLSSYTLPLNHRRKLFGHVFSGRYKAVTVGPGNNYPDPGADKTNPSFPKISPCVSIKSGRN